MLRPIYDVPRIAFLQQVLRSRLYSLLPNVTDATAGFQGDSLDVQLHSDGDLWYTTDIVGSPRRQRYWNAYGRLSSGHPGDIIVETNIPLRGRDLRVGALFGEDADSGSTFLLHTGKIGGGRAGIGKSAFIDWVEGQQPSRLVRLPPEHSPPDFVIEVAELHAQSFLSDIKAFVLQAERFKEWATGQHSR
jgi:hypothetical protein